MAAATRPRRGGAGGPRRAPRAQPLVSELRGRAAAVREGRRRGGRHRAESRRRARGHRAHRIRRRRGPRRTRWRWAASAVRRSDVDRGIGTLVRGDAGRIGSGTLRSPEDHRCGGAWLAAFSGRGRPISPGKTRGFSGPCGTCSPSWKKPTAAWSRCMPRSTPRRIALRQAEDRLRVLLDSVHDYAICMLGVDGQVETWNAGAERLFGYAADRDRRRQRRLLLHGGRAGARRARREPAGGACTLGRLECECAARPAGRVRRSMPCVLLTPMRRPMARREASRSSCATSPSASGSRTISAGAPTSSPRPIARRKISSRRCRTSCGRRSTRCSAGRVCCGWASSMRPRRSRALETIERNAHVQEQLIADILDVSRIVTGKLRLELRPMELAPIDRCRARRGAPGRGSERRSACRARSRRPPAR